MKQIKIKDLKEMELFINKFSKTIKTGTLILFNGQLGSGKTTMIKMIAKNLNIKEIITSPTYNLKNEYIIDEKSKLIHLDLYRLGNKALESFNEIIYEDVPNNIVCIEWPSKEIMDKYTSVKVNIKVNKDNSRTVQYG